MDGTEQPDDELTAWLKREINHMLDMEYAMYIHTRLWGVPYGPTLTMVYPKKMLDIGAIFGLTEN